MLDMVRVDFRECVAADVEPGQVRQLLHHVGQGVFQSVQPHVKVLEGLNSVKIFGNSTVRVYNENHICDT